MLNKKTSNLYKPHLGQTRPKNGGFSLLHLWVLIEQKGEKKSKINEE